MPVSLRSSPGVGHGLTRFRDKLELTLHVSGRGVVGEGAADAQSPGGRRGGGLLRLAIAEPADALARAQAMATVSSDPWILSVARHAQGVVLRDQGRTGEAVRELRSARDLARRSGDADRLADVRATLGSALALDGQTRSGLQELDRAVAGAVDRTVRARCLMRRGYVLTMILARHRDAPADLKGALKGARMLGDRLWEARTLSTMSFVHFYVGDVVLRGAGAGGGAPDLRGGGPGPRGGPGAARPRIMALFRGDVPRALRLYDEAGVAYARWGDPPVELGEDRCQAMLAAGLPGEACAVAVELLANQEIPPANRVELQLYLALGELARGDVHAALAAAREARDIFRRQGRDVAAARAELVVLSARRRMGAKGAAVAETAARLARRLEEARSEDAPVAWLLAGRVAVDARAGRRGGSCGPRRPVTAATHPVWSGPPRGWPRPSAVNGETRCGGCGKPAAMAWTPSTTTGPPWAAPSCGRWRPYRATSWPGWRCPMRSTPVRGPSSGGASAGAPRRWPCRQ